VTSTPPHPRATWSTAHQLAGLILLATLVALKAVAAYRYRFNTDETQHLHVIWGWTRGLIEYRDLFDNHPPLFHMLMAPIFRMFPERADIVVPMRLLMIPFYVASLAAVYRIGRALYSPRTAIWLALIAGVLPAFFFPGTEFRPDDPYAALWLWVLVIAVENHFTTTRAVVMGLLLGICVGITIKTALLLSSLAMATGISFGLRYWLARWRPSSRQLFIRVIVLGIAGAVMPVLLCLYFAAHHALPQLYYCVLKHNVVPNGERWNGSSLHYYYLPIGLPFVLAAAFGIYKSSPDASVATRRVLIAVLPAVYYLLMYSYWPEITDHDNMPAMPLVPLALMPLIVWLSAKLPLPAIGYLSLPAAFAVCISLIWHTHVLQRGSVEKYVSRIAIVLKLTNPDEYVMDLKGDAIYRPRPIYYAIETFARARMKLGWIKDNIAERLIATRTAVCFHPPYPGAASMKFINANYLPLALHPNIMVLGQSLPKPSAGAIPFTVSIPAQYVLLEQNQPASGILDGHPYIASQTLSAGSHQFLPANPAASVTLFWARAWEDGYPPDTGEPGLE
jgi:4-amino-4-deoxy-L-arabinose transferase-like glycosyltransferase